MAALDVESLKARASQVMKGFAPAQLVIIGLLSVVALVAAFSFLRWVTAPTYGVLLSGMSAGDASLVTEKLSADGVPYKLEAGGTSVLVPTTELDAQRIAVAAEGLPKGTTDGYELLDAQGLTSSSFQQQIAYQRALEGELDRTLMSITGVDDAQVHLALPEKSLFTEDKAEPSASVLLTTSGDLTDDSVEAVVHLVASAVPDLLPASVSVTDSRGRLLTGDGTATGGGGSKLLRAQADTEAALTARAESMLTQLLGPDRAVVRVTAEMDNATRTVDTETFDPEGTVALSETKSAETYDTAEQQTEQPEGVVEVDDPIDPAGEGTSEGTTGGYSKSDSATTYGVNRTVERQELGPGGLKRLSVAVAVDSKAPNAPTTVEVQQMVANAVGLDPARGDTISVTSAAFLVDVEEVVPEDGAAAAGSTSMMTYGTTGIALALLLLTGLGFLRTIRKGMATDIPPAELAAAGANRLGDGGRPALPAGAVPGQRTGDDTRILDLADERPDEIATLLRGWLADSGSER